MDVNVCYRCRKPLMDGGYILKTPIKHDDKGKPTKYMETHACESHNDFKPLTEKAGET